jgi:hypothetical protein
MKESEIKNYKRKTLEGKSALLSGVLLSHIDSIINKSFNYETIKDILIHGMDKVLEFDADEISVVFYNGHVFKIDGSDNRTYFCHQDVFNQNWELVKND